MDARFNEIQAGWSVVGSDGDKIGDIEEVRRDHLLVTKGLIFRTDLYIPMTAITDVHPTDGRVVLSVPKGEVEQRGWTEPPAEAAALGWAGTAGAPGVGAVGDPAGTADEPLEGLGYVGRSQGYADAERQSVGAGTGSSAYGATGTGDDYVDPSASGMEPGSYDEAGTERDRGPAGEMAGGAAGALGGAALGGAVGGPPGAVVGGVAGAAGGAAVGDEAEHGMGEDEESRRRQRPDEDSSIG